MAQSESLKLKPAVRHAKHRWRRKRDFEPFNLENGVLALVAFGLMVGIDLIDRATTKAEEPRATFNQAAKSGYTLAKSVVVSKLDEGEIGLGQCQIITPCDQALDDDTEGVPIYWDVPTNAIFVAAGK